MVVTIYRYDGCTDISFRSGIIIAVGRRGMESGENQMG
jgi:hypothetical protein